MVHEGGSRAGPSGEGDVQFLTREGTPIPPIPERPALTAKPWKLLAR
jgi:hypothetical protein